MPEDLTRVVVKWNYLEALEEVARLAEVNRVKDDVFTTARLVEALEHLDRVKEKEGIKA